MRYAIIDGVNVINVIDYDVAPSNPPPSFESPVIAVQSDTAGVGWTYVDGQFIAPPTPAPTPEFLISACKNYAVSLLNATDWTTIPDVANPSASSPYLMNQGAFIAWRSQVRALAINPVANPVFPTQPTEQWSS
jgi:hypothetical protein